MNLSTNRNLSKRIRYSYSSFFPYKQKIYDTNAKKLNKSNTKIKKESKDIFLHLPNTQNKA